MRYSTLVLFVFISNMLFSQITAVSSLGDTVLLNDDGTWELSSNEHKVYVTEISTRYHRSSCVFSVNVKAISIDDAGKKGYSACKICKPVSTDRINSKSTQSTPSESSDSKKCYAIIKEKSGVYVLERICGRTTVGSSAYCWEHPDGYRRIYIK